jgi:2-methylcitrate dehydratase PrpD
MPTHDTMPSRPQTGIASVAPPEEQVSFGRRGFIAGAVLAGAAPALLPAALPTIAAAQTADEGAGATVRLAAYGAGLRFEDIPAAAVQRAKDCMTDAVATIIYGADLPWSRMIIDYARRTGAAGRSQILGAGEGAVQPAMAALAQGAMAHAFELDNLTKPDSGGHPGAVLFSSGLAVAQDRGLGGRALLTALVAGAEVMIRIGYATLHSDEERGFHAPSSVGPFGGAITVGHLLGFDPPRMTNALGIAGSCSGGLLAFAHSGDGAMVKRFNLGRGAEGGVVAASLAEAGFSGPSTIVEGEGGFLRAFCPTWDMAQLTDRLGGDFKTMTIMIKRYACHITAHTPVEAMLDLRRQHGFTAADIVKIAIAGSPRMATVNNIPAPTDALLAQFSIPFCVALAMYRDPIDPRSFDEAVVKDQQILALAQLVTMSASPGQSNTELASTVTVTLRDGRVVSQHVTAFTGTPERPLDRDGLRQKFMLLTKAHPEPAMSRLFERLQQIEAEPDLGWLKV